MNLGQAVAVALFSLTAAAETKRPEPPPEASMDRMLALWDYLQPRLAAVPRFTEVRQRRIRQMLYRHVPKHLIERPKQGFGVPLDAWLRGPLRDWAEALLAPAKLRQQGLLNAELVQRKWHEHQTGKRNWQHQLWDVLMFQAWLEQWG